MEYYKDFINNFDKKDIDLINVEAIDVFVYEHIKGLIINYGLENCRLAILLDDETNEIYLTIQYIIEVGGSLLLSRISTFIDFNQEKRNAFYNIISSLLNRSLYYYLMTYNLHSSTNLEYFSPKSLSIITNRLEEHFFWASQMSSYVEYSNEMYLKYLQFLIGFNELKWINFISDRDLKLNKFGDLCELKYGEFNFTARKLLIWKKGEIIYQNEVIYSITNNIINNTLNKVFISPSLENLRLSVYGDIDIKNKINTSECISILKNIINNTSYYYSMIKINDRLMLLNMPINSQDVNVNGIKTLINQYNVKYYPDFISLNSKDSSLDVDMPYCCSLFYKKNKLEAISFSLFNDTLIKFIS
jgi:hypothetical protein